MNKKMFLISVFSFLIFSISFLFIPNTSDMIQLTLPVKNVIAGITIWVTLAVGIITQILLSKGLKTFLNKKGIMSYRKIGVISFFQNKYASLADISFFISLVCFVVSMVCTNMNGNNFINFIFWTILVFSFSMHCILNGKVFYYMSNQEKL